MISHRERVLSALRHAGTDVLPKGELFLPIDLLDRYFPEQKGEHVKQLASVARLFGLSLLGADLGEERLYLLLVEKRFGKLDQFFTVGCINGPVSHMIGHLGFFEAMTSIRKNPHRLAELTVPLIKDIKKSACSPAITVSVQLRLPMILPPTADFCFPMPILWT